MRLRLRLQPVRGETVLVYCCVLTHGSHTVVLRSLPSAYTLSLVTQRDWVPLHPCFGTSAAPASAARGALIS